MSTPNSIYPRINLLGAALQQTAVGTGPTTGFYRNNYCDATPMDGASHTVAAVVTEEFLSFSASRGNDLRSLLSPGDSWCLCAKRWNESVQASLDHPLGEAIVPRVQIEATHEKAAEVIGAGGKELLLKYAVVKGEVAEEDKKLEL